MKLTPKKILWGLLIIFIVIYTIGFASHLAWGHETNNMKHIDGDLRLENIIASNFCYAGTVKQNKIVLYQDFDRDGVVDTCFTIWVEHGKLHAIISDPVGEYNDCECQGYVWFDDDSQNTLEGEQDD